MANHHNGKQKSHSEQPSVIVPVSDGSNDIADSHHHHQGSMDGQPLRKIEDILHIAELCIDLLQENQDFYAEVTSLVFLVLLTL